MSAAKANTYRQNLITEAKKYIGCPYSFGAIGPDSFDCSGLIYHVAREANKTQLPRTCKALYSYVTIVSDADKEPGDLLFFKTTSSNTISHVGIYIGNNQFISAVSDGPNTGVILSSLKESYWKPRYVGAGQIYKSSKTADTQTEDENLYGEKITAPVSKPETPATEPVPKTVEKPDTSSENKTANSNSKSKKSTSKTGDYFLSNERSSFYSSSSSFPDSLVFDASVLCDWSFLGSESFLMNYRGIDFHLNARLSNIILEPGLGFICRWNYGLSVFQLPVIFTLTINDFIRFYAGPVFTFGNTEARYSNINPTPVIFPGTVGLSFSTPSFLLNDVKLQVVQDIAYSFNTQQDGSWLSAMQSLSDGLILYTGLRLTIPFNIF
ncbi:MAG: C40 family peptidase [Treponema sp.]|nr:C40 family peptidase [Treponema sp.]